MALLDELAVRRVQADIVKLLNALALGVNTVAVGSAVGNALLGGTGLGGVRLGDVGRVGVVERAEVGGDGPRAVDGGLEGVRQSKDVFRGSLFILTYSAERSGL
jgi:hypothetical protein